jgi:hypothetical protein
MLRATILASALVASLAIPARANDIQRSIEVSKPRPALPAEVVEVQSPRRSPGSVIITDAVGGAVLGAAAGGGVVLYNRYVASNGNWDNWERTVLIGAGIGLGVGLVFGAIDAAANADRGFTGPVADRRQTGFSAPLASHGLRF